MKELEIGHYPFTAEEDEKIVKIATFQHMHKLLEHTVFENTNTQEAFLLFSQYYKTTKELFGCEENARKQGMAGANLFYHGKEHSIYQATYDAIMVTRAILERNDEFSGHVTPEGAFAIPIGALLHDIGYPLNGPHENYAARTPVHVTEGMKGAEEIIEKLGVPKTMNMQRIKELVSLGIHTTNFPFTQEHKEEAREKLETFSPEKRKEAQIVRLAVQFADLGGQTARIDYYPHLVRKLREEMNAAKAGMGNIIIGNEDELDTKCRGFMNFVVKQTVGKTGNAFFGEFSNPYFKAWIKNGL